MLFIHTRYLGIEMSNEKSKIYLCTDADAKDEDKQGDVMAGLIAKQLTPVFLLTGQCSRRRRKRNSGGGRYLSIDSILKRKCSSNLNKSTPVLRNEVFFSKEAGCQQPPHQN